MSGADPDWRILEGDCIAVMAAMSEASVDAVVCDPPYGLGFMGKAWDTDFTPADSPMRRTAALDAVNAGATRQGGRQRAGADFQKRQARDARTYQEWCEAWGVEALRVLKPGGYLLAMGGTRTYHRLASGLEDAGFEVRDMLEWFYGSGFPKHESCLKPAHEPVMLGRKASRYSEPLQIDAARIEATPEDIALQRARTGGAMDADDGRSIYGGGKRRPAGNDAGRWPANVVLDPEAAAMLDEQSGTLTSGKMDPTHTTAKRHIFGQNVEAGYTTMETYGDSGGASRFFYVAKPDTAERNVGLQGRNPHPTVKPVELMRWLCRLVTPKGGTILDPFTGSGTTGIAALREGFSFVGIEQDADYIAVARARIIGDAPLLNTYAEMPAA